MLNVKISIIIPCFNVQNYINECLASVYAQTYSNFEVICIDNNSTDETPLILSILKEKYSQIIIATEEKPGATAARNKGLSISKGKWIQFLDADDLLLPNKIEHQLKLLDSLSENIPFIAAASYKQKVGGQKSVHQPELNPWKGIFSSNLGNTCANLFNKDAVMKVGGWNSGIKSSQEYDLMFRLLKTFGAPFLDDVPLTIIRERESGQISQRNPKEKWMQYVSLREEMIEYLKEYQTEEWNVNNAYYLNKFFTKLRLYAKEDLKNAIVLFNKYFKKEFVPEKSLYISKYYIFIFKFLGFEKTEKLHKLIRP